LNTLQYRHGKCSRHGLGLNMASINHYDCLERAKVLLASGDDASLRYACLELRYCMEAVTYEKLRAYAPRLPPDILSMWQPPQLVKALLELEGDADQEYTVAIKPTGSSQPFQIMGEHRTFATKWIRKHYHSIGSYLHAPKDITPGRRPRQIEPQELRQYLEDVIAECTRVAESSITSTLAEVVVFDCQLCDHKTVTNLESAKRRGRVSCLHPECEADYVVSTAEDGALYFRPDGWVFPCQACRFQMLVPSKRLVADHEFSCNACGRRHKLVKDWYYAIEVERGAEV
jgi:hypothetical protein